MSTSRSDSPAVAADYFDGLSARPRKVTLALDGERLRVRGEQVSRDDALATLRVSEPMDGAPRLVSFPDGAHCEVRDHAAFGELLRLGGHADGWVVRLQQRWRAALAAIAVTAAALAAAYVWGLPALSEAIALKVPERVAAQIGQGTLEFLDRAALGPSELPAARQQALRAAFARLAPPDAAAPRHQVIFRKGVKIGANALALPDGTIVVTDELAGLAADDEEIMGVLAHELGHVARRHGLRMLIQGSIVAFVVAWYLGDVSSVAAGLPVLLLQASYSRDHEREADRYAAAMLKANGISPRRLGDMLAKLEDAQREKGGGNDAGERTRQPGYSASHPVTEERIRALSE